MPVRSRLEIRPDELVLAAERRDPAPFLELFEVLADERGLSSGTRRSYRSAIERFFAFLWRDPKLPLWDKRAPERWAEHMLDRGARPNTVRIYLEGLRFFIPVLNDLVGWQMLLPRMHQHREHVLLDDDTYALALTQQAGDEPRCVLGRLILRLIGEEGVRPKEFLMARVGDYQPASRTLELRKDPNARRPRHLILQDATAADLEAWLELRPRYENWGMALFLNPYGRVRMGPFPNVVALSRASVKVLKPAGACGLALTYPLRALRNRAAIFWFRKTGNPVLAARRLGLRSIPYVLRGFTTAGLEM